MFLFGYNIGVLNAPEKVIFPGHTTAQWSTTVSSFCIGGILGAYFAGGLADRFGRRKCILAAGCIHLISGLLMLIAPNINMLIVGRTITGIAGGASTVLTPMYLSEISPVFEGQ